MTQITNQHRAGVPAQQAYLQLLRTEGLPQGEHLRPDFAELEPTIQLIEDVARKSHGNVRAIDRTITTLLASIPALAALLDTQENTPSTVEVIRDDTRVPPLPEGVAFPPEVSQGACRWLDHYETYSRAVSPEGYDDFHVACGCSRRSPPGGCMSRSPNGCIRRSLSP